MAIYDGMTRQEDNDTYKYLVAIEKLYREIQKIERQLIILLKERRLQLETGFDTLLTREDAAQVLGMPVFISCCFFVCWLVISITLEID